MSANRSHGPRRVKFFSTQKNYYLLLRNVTFVNSVLTLVQLSRALEDIQIKVT